MEFGPLSKGDLVKNHDKAHERLVTNQLFLIG